MAKSVVRLIIAIISTLKQATKRTTRELLLDAAARVIARDGFQGARLADVAREAGLTTGAIYSNFRDKEELFLAAFSQIQGVSSEPPEGSGVDGLLAVFRRDTARFEASRQLQVLNLELALLGARDARIRKLLRESQLETREMVARDLPGTPEEARELAGVLMALANGVAFMRMIAPDTTSVEAAERALRRLADIEHL